MGLPSLAFAAAICGTLAWRPAVGFNALHYNLGWECMSAWATGSGKVASRQCKPGYFSEGQGAFGISWHEYPDAEAFKFRTPAYRRTPEDTHNITINRLMDTYITSCSWRMLEALQEWQEKYSFDIVTFVELCSPGADGEHVAGFIAQDGSEYSSRQCSPKIFDLLMEKVFTSHGIFVNAVRTEYGPVTQLTIYSNTFGGEPDIAIGTDVTEGRPMSALLWSIPQVMVLNIHSVHYRKSLILDRCARRGAGGSQDMCTWAETHYPNGTLAADRALAFSASRLSTANLQALFGEFVTARIAEQLVLRKFCMSVPKCSEKLTDWRIIAQGDFNDETGELFDLPLFGKRVHLQSDARVRTCCSDRDEYWTRPYAGEPFEAYSELPSGGEVFEPTEATWTYLLRDCKYEGPCRITDATCKDSYQKSCPNAIIHSMQAGAPRPAGEKGGHFSRYPFPSDLILDSEIVLEFGFPKGYTQSIRGAISDHDPVIAILGNAPTRSPTAASSDYTPIAVLVLVGLIAYCGILFVRGHRRSLTRKAEVDSSDDSSANEAE